MMSPVKTILGWGLYFLSVIVSYGWLTAGFDQQDNWIKCVKGDTLHDMSPVIDVAGLISVVVFVPGFNLTYAFVIEAQTNFPRWELQPKPCNTHS